MGSGISTKLTAAAAVAALAATPVLAEKARQLQDINGMDVYGAERALIDRGFKSISSHRNTQGYVYSYWWDKADDKCVLVEVYERSNRVESIKDASDQDCGQHKGDAAVAVGAIAATALLGALLSGGKSHHKEGRDYDRDQTAEFDRGYTDGLHNAPYHNYSRSDAYSHGYEKGTDERQANLRHHKGRGGYVQTVQFNDLRNARASGGMSELEQRGFRQVDNFTSGNTRYSIQYHPSTRQCLQVTIADGRFYDIRDIRTHPKCNTNSSSSSRDDAWIGRLVGAAGDGAGTYMENQGFRPVDSFRSGRNGSGSVWYNRSTRQCVQMIVVNGRVDSAMDIGSHPRCR
ncbi:hypothetical protein ACI5KX_13060 [Erythrobacter sp. GH1-10]|uniref:hypothetical protein n=1 Tax=Erythrobacter sp. GH1-10 TaxID=3349334 RepID=UPI003877F123